MKAFLNAFQIVLAALLTTSQASFAAEESRAANLVALTKMEVQNLQIETAVAEERRFEKTFFAVGGTEEIPANNSVLSSRISGRIVSLNAFVGDTVAAGDIVAVVESRQPGNPPPTISLKAPQAGLVVESHVKLGEPVTPDKELLDISDRSELWAVAMIPEREPAVATNGTPARIRVPALGGLPINATLERIDVSADRKSGTVRGIFVIQNLDDRLRPGMRAEFSVITSEREDVMSIPTSAIQGDAKQPIVFVEDFELPNAFLRSPIVTGEKNDQFIEVISGLFPGDSVVTRGSYALSFAGGGSISLKEALDAAHGHEHAEDGSELTAADRKKAAQAKEGNTQNEASPDSSLTRFMQIYAGIMTLLCIILAQLLWNRRRSAANKG